MNSLMNYGSDDDYDDSSEEKQTDWRASSSRDKGAPGKATDVNYEEVQMDLSETPEPPPSSSRRTSRTRSRDSRDRRDSASRDSRDRRDSASRDSRDRRESASRDRRERRGGSRDKDSRSSRGRRDRDRDRERDRKSRRSASRERDRDRDRRDSSRRSRTPPRRSDREPKHSRSRSRSRDRARKYAKRHERGSSKSEPPEKNERPKTNTDDEKRTNQSESDRFFMPGITGRFRDQIERRKQLWQKKDAPAAAAAKVAVNNGQSKKVWEATTFAQDTDGKVASKFKRLMGIRGSAETTGPAVDNLRKQEEMFSSMEQQYEVARTATHTMRGVGLGFGSFQR